MTKGPRRASGASPRATGPRAPARSSAPPPVATPKPPSAPRRPRAPARKQPPPGRPVSTLVGLALVGALLAFALYAGFYLVTPHRGRGAAVRVAMPEHGGADATALALYRAGVVDRPWLFAWMLALTGTADRVPQGFLPLRDDLTPRAVLRAIASGVGLVRVTVPEGYTRFEIGDRLAAAGLVPSADEFVRRTQDPAVLAHYGVRGDSLEGYLFPDTYDVPTGSSADEIIDRMVSNARRRVAAARDAHPDGVARADRAGLDDRALLVLASLVEKETGAPEDRARVASVFWNRLTAPEFEPRKLQSDPTIVYGCHAARPPSCADAPRTGRMSITRAMRDDPANPYNTYTHVGLPPGPIANPGLRALEAVLAPAETRDLYFVAMGNGRSAFAATLEEHQANVARYLRPGAGAARDAGAAP